MVFTPLILGSGRAGQAAAKAFALLSVIRPDLSIAPAVTLRRGESLADARQRFESPILCVANPHALHPNAILEAESAGFAGVLCEKPAAVNLEQVAALRRVLAKVAVLHVYRETWGMRTLHRMVQEGAFGEVFAIEGRYWQASAAERLLKRAAGELKPGWKDDPKLAGGFDTYLDVGVHWVDAASYLYGGAPRAVKAWLSHAGSDSSARDTHVQLCLDYPRGRGFASISKILHGAPNHFEINVLGSKLSGTWHFLNPDEILLGEGRSRRVLTRQESSLGSRQDPHHGVGWLEGYVEIAGALCDSILGRPGTYPALGEHLDLLEAMLKAEGMGVA